jgi:tetratricopeptide (TPR) repeat protein
MSSNIPVARQIAWISILPQLAFMLLLIFLWYFVYPRMAVNLGVITYLILSISLRNLIPKDHKNGMKSIAQNDYSYAIHHFQKSYDYFQKYKWIDEYRYLIVFSSSKISYREMALNNIAFCYAQTGNAAEARAYYEKTLIEFPDSYLAKSALKMIETFDQKQVS